MPTDGKAALMGALQRLKFVAEREAKLQARDQRVECLSFRLSNYPIAPPQVEDYTLRIDEMQELFRKREADFNTVQDGMRKIEEFQKTKAQMEQELGDVRISSLSESSDGCSHKPVT